MSNKHPIAGYHHDKQINSRVWILTCLPLYDEDDDDDPDMNFCISTTRMWIRIKKREAKWDALI